MPGSSLPKFGWQFSLGWDKLAHFVVYAVLAVLIGWAIQRRSNIKFSNLLCDFLVCSAYGTLLECFQHWFLVDRVFEVPDLIANIIGSFAGTFIVHLRRGKKNILWISQ